MSEEALERALLKIKEQVCSKPDHENQPILRVCINQQCCLNFNIDSLLCADCLIHHATHYQDCIKIDKFILQCNQNEQNSKNQTTKDIQIDSIIVELTSQMKNFKKKLKEIQDQYKKDFKKCFNELIVDELLQLQIRKSHDQSRQNVNISLKELIEKYKGNKTEEDVIDLKSLFQTVLKTSENNLTSLMSDISNSFIKITQATEQKLKEMNSLIQNHSQVEINVEEEEKQKNVIKLIAVSQEEIMEQIKHAEIEKSQTYKELKKFQNMHFELQEQEKVLYYKVEQKKKLDQETKRSFMQKIQNLMEKQINIKYLEEQRIQIDGGIKSQMFLTSQNNNFPRKNQNDYALLIQDQDQSSEFMQEQIIFQLQNGGSMDDLDHSKQQQEHTGQKNELEIDGVEKEKYIYIEKTKQYLQEKQEQYQQVYSREIQNLSNQLLETANQKENCALQVEVSKNKYNQSTQYYKQLQLQLQSNEDLKFVERKKMIDLYKKSPIKRKILHF